MTARFDLYNSPSKSKAKTPYLLDVQSYHLGNLSSRVVIPITRVAGSYTANKIAQDLSPIVVINDEQFVLEKPLLAAFALAELVFRP